MKGRNIKAGCTAFTPISGWRVATACTILCLLVSGCYAPIHSAGIEARTLPDEFRWPQRTAAARLNYSSLVGLTQAVYLLGTGDRLEVTVPDLITKGTAQTFQVTVLDHGEIYLPRLGSVGVGGLSLAQAQQQVNAALAGSLLQNPGAVVTLVEKGTVNVLVLGAVQRPGIHALPRFENDVAHALAAAQGFSENAGDVIEIHRRQQFMSTENVSVPKSGILTASFQTASMDSGMPQPHGAGGSPIHIPTSPLTQQPFQVHRYGGHSLGQLIDTPAPTFSPGMGQGSTEGSQTGMPIIRIPLRGVDCLFNPGDVTLNVADVVIVPQKTDKVFYVVGPLSGQNRFSFSSGDRNREIGNGLLLPDDREVDVVTAVVMAGYIDPIESPTTVTVHRAGQNGMPLLIRVDLIAARSDPKETILVQPGDIIYLNPDPFWYSRRLMDRVIDRALGTAVGRWLTN